MKKLLFTLITTINFLTLSFGQVGINTQNPQGILNIDGGKDNPITGSGHSADQQLNDFTVLANGNVGIGTIAPSQKLEIQTGGTESSPITGFKLIDGNQRKNYVLMSDADGIGTWQLVTMKGINGTFVAANSNNNRYYFASNEDNYVNTGSYIILPPGKWRVDLTQLLRPAYTNNQTLTANDYIFIRFTFTDSASSVLPMAGSNFDSGVIELVSGSYSGPTTTSVLKYGVLNGYVVIKNETNSEKNYYLLAGNSLASNSYRPEDVNGTTKIGSFFFQNIGSSSWRENRMVAIPLSDN